MYANNVDTRYCVQTPNMQVEIQPENYECNKKMCAENGAYSKLDHSINKIIEKEGFLQYKIDKKCISTNGGNYLGELCEVDVKGKTKEGDKDLNIFVKSMNSNGDDNLKIISIPNVYKTELFFYKELSKIFHELQEEARVPLNKKYKTVKSYDESENDVILMENLSRQGFITVDRMDVVSLKFAEMSIQELAKFHAFSFVLKEKRPEFFERRIKTMKSPFVTGKDWDGFITNMVSNTKKFIDISVKDRIEKFSLNIGDKYASYYRDEKSQRCLIHGDFRPNNILTKIINGEESEVVVVDYQLLYYGCPIIDFVYFITCGTDRKFRQAHLSNLKDLYFETLKEFLKYFEIDVEDVYPRKVFDMEYEEKKDFGLMMALIILPFMFASETDVPDISKEDLSQIEFKVNDEKFKERFCGIIEDFIDNGVL